MSDLKQPLEQEHTPPAAEAKPTATGYPPATTEAAAPGTAVEDSRWVKAYGSARERLPASLSSRLPTSEEAKASVDSLSARFASSSAETSESFKARKAKLRSELFSHGYSVANATQIPLYISLNQVGPLMYEAVEPNGVFERRAPGLFFLLEVRASGDPYTPWSVAWPILAVTGPAVALTSLLAIPFAAAVTGSAALAGMSTAVMSGIATASSAVTAAGTTVRPVSIPMLTSDCDHGRTHRPTPWRQEVARQARRRCEQPHRRPQGQGHAGGAALRHRRRRRSQEHAAQGQGAPRDCEGGGGG